MSASLGDENPVIERIDDIIAYMETGYTPDRRDWRIGSEHEKFIFHRGSNKPLAYEAKDGRPGVRDVLLAFVARGWEAVYENENIIAAKKDGASLTLEPGGQFELSGAPLETLHQTCHESTSHLKDVCEIGQALNIGFMGLGLHPTLTLDTVHLMPKARYDIMRAYMPQVGNMGLDMMLRTCTVQVNIDFADETDMVEKLRIGFALQPLAVALFANSPFNHGQLNGMLSMRSHMWTQTDPDRTGLLPFVFEDGMGYPRYVEHVLDVPMYFVCRDGRFLDAAGQSFRDFLAGNLPALPGEKPRLSDWQDHLTTLYPEVRLKTYIEMRGADGGSKASLCSLPAFWVGLLYDAKAQAAAYDIINEWSFEDIARARTEVPRLGLKTQIKGQTFQELGRRVLEISDRGLKARARLSSTGESEQVFLHSLWKIIETGKTPADILIEKYQGRWQSDINQIFDEYRYT